MNNISLFTYGNNEVRTIQIDGEPWFVLKDVCDILALANPSMIANRLDEDERSKFDLGRQGEGIIINESGLYNVILRSDKPKAKSFRKWVTNEVLPTIRKHGGYLTVSKMEEALLNPDTIIELAIQLKQERERRAMLESKVSADKGKVLFAEAVETAKNSILIGDLAKILKGNGIDVGRDRLFEYLRNNGYLIRKGAERNMPTQYSMELGLMEVKESTSVNPDGTIRVNKTTKITGKGQLYFVKHFLQRKVA